MSDKQIYAMNIGKIGESMKAISTLFGDASSRRISSADELKALINEYKAALVQLQNTRNTFRNLIAPIGFDAEHNKMLKAFESYVTATEDMVHAVEVNHKDFKTEAFREAEARQQQATEAIVRSTAESAKKMFP